MAAWPKQVWSSESMQQSCLMPLSACSDASEKDLREQLSKAERLLKLGELCRKLERKREKVLIPALGENRGRDKLAEIFTPLLYCSSSNSRKGFFMPLPSG